MLEGSNFSFWSVSENVPNYIKGQPCSWFMKLIMHSLTQPSDRQAELHGGGIKLLVPYIAVINPYSNSTARAH